MTTTFRSLWEFTTPGWLQDDEGSRVSYTQGLVFDAFAERCHQTALLGLPSRTPDDALGKIGQERGLIRGVFEPAESFRNRLIGWRYPRGHRVRGSAAALLSQVSAAIRGTEFRTIDQRGTEFTFDNDGFVGVARNQTWDWDGAALLPNWGRYWVVVKSTGASWPTLGDGAWGPTVLGDEGVCLAGSGVHSGELDAIVKLCSSGRLGWTPFGRQPVYLVIWFDGDTYPVPGGDWDDWESRDAEYRYVPLHESQT